MNAHTLALEQATIRHYCKQLRTPTIGAQFEKMAEEAAKQKQSHVRYLEVLLAAEVEERERRVVERRLKEARLPRVKTLEEFDFGQSPRIAATEIRELAEGRYLEQAEPVVFIGDCGTGKTHLASGLCVAACRQKRRVRFTTAAGLVNELVEAQHHNQLGRVLARWARYELITVDEVGYVPLAEVGVVSSDRRPSGENSFNPYHQSTLFRMDPGLSQRPAMQSPVGSDYRPGSHYRDWHGILPVQTDPGKTAEAERLKGPAVDLVGWARPPLRPQTRPRVAQGLHSGRGLSQRLSSITN
jgi:IstB-like ATP binding protein